MTRPRIRPLLLSMLLCFLVTLLIAWMDALKKELPAQRIEGLVGGVLLAALLSLSALPIRLLLGIFPEPSQSSLVRLLRRFLLGVVCGPVPLLLVMAVVSSREDFRAESAEVAFALGLLMGGACGLVDAVVREERTR